MSKVRSITLDSWEPELLKVMTELGNERVNQIFEAVIGDEFSRPTHNSLRSQQFSFLSLLIKNFLDSISVSVSMPNSHDSTG